MCSPKVSLSDLQIKRRKYFKDVVLNDVEKIFAGGQPARNSKVHFKKETEYNFVSLAIFRGMQTYSVEYEVKGLSFKKIGPNAKELAKWLDYQLVDNKREAVNGFYTKK